MRREGRKTRILERKQPRADALPPSSQQIGFQHASRIRDARI